MEKRDRILWMILIICLIFIFGISAIVAIIDRRQRFENQEPEITINGNIDYEPTAENLSVKLKATDGITFKADLLTQGIDIENPESNTYLIRGVILLGDGTELFQTDFISPGGSCKQVAFSTTLKAGTYHNSILVYKIYTFEEEFVTQCEFPIEITVI